MPSHRSTPLTDEIRRCHSWLKSHGQAPPEIAIDRLPNPEFTIAGRPFLSFSSNNYLGLSTRPEVIESGREAIGRHTMGTCESRRLGGNLRLLEELEERIARFKGGKAAMVFATGLLANVATIPGLMRAQHFSHHFFNKPPDETPPGLILSDALNHRSIQMGITLAKTPCHRYRHGDMDHLAALLEENQGQKILIVTDAVFSMDGDLAPLDQITRLAGRYQATVMIDDAHGTGLFGPNGRGVAEHFGVEDHIQIHMGTLSKAAGALGGFVVAEPEIIAFLKLSASGYRFTSSLPAEQAAGIITAFDIMEQEPSLRQQLWKNTFATLKGMLALGLDIPLRPSPIIPILLGSEEKATMAADILYQKGLLCVAATPPLVPQGESRLRVTINASHTPQHIEKLLMGLQEMADRLKLPPKAWREGAWLDFIQSTPAYIRHMIEEKP
ncbi:MAG: aminotransferase class I/II-fold pyridoxal phosphate-dependent enzyme [Magnetococcales bacterium]|nr:aminotransferase class I/II-fold pyridoxal phosphate-dependent enzyme [Magnetococcales bacterium]